MLSARRGIRDVGVESTSFEKGRAYSTRQGLIRINARVNPSRMAWYGCACEEPKLELGLAGHRASTAPDNLP
jgi:hypothetical protein